MHDASAAMELDPDERETDDSTKTILGLMRRIEITSYSTAFSGVDSPGMSLAMIRAAVGSWLEGVEIQHPEHITGVDTWFNHVIGSSLRSP